MVFERTYRGAVRLVVFDWAGTTVDFGCLAPIRAFIEGFRAKGIDVDERTARGPMGMEKRAHIRAVFEDEAVAQAWRRQYGRGVTEADIDAIFDDFVPQLLGILSRYSTIIPG
ncbi:MAG: hypothetical protein V2I35_04775, partial [Desulfocapsaceae bacterium]|nr:hypothetical protein [Desulfocapsaceae bacterium]